MLIGFVCPLNGDKTNMDFCVSSCPNRCLELPLLLALYEQRTVVPNTYSVTEILKPPRPVAFHRTTSYWANPYDLIYSTFGTAWHEVVSSQRYRLEEMGINSYWFEEENHFEVEIEPGIILRGTPDQYDYKTHTLTDYKTLKYYFDVMYLCEKNDWSGSTYHWQVNIYRRYKFPDCKKMQLVALVKDYNRRLKYEKGVLPVMKIAVPWIADEEIDKLVHKSIKEIREAENDLSKARDCSDMERWKDNVRCREFCYVADTCPQWSRIKEKK